MASIEQEVAGLEQPAPPGLKQGVLYRIGQETGSVKKSKRRFWGVGTGMGLAAAVLVLMVGVGVIRMPKPKEKVKAAASAAQTADADPYEIDPDSLEDMRNPAPQILPDGEHGSKHDQYGLPLNGETAEDLPVATRGSMTPIPVPADTAPMDEQD